MTQSTDGHRWQFFRAGGVDQVALRDGRDLLRLPDLDPKLWMALAMPVKGTQLDARTLELLDTDADGRIRVPEVVGACRFVEATFADPDDLARGGESLSLDAIRDPAVAAAARRVLASLGKPDAKLVTLDDVKAHAEAVAKLPLNGDGVVPPDAAGDPELSAVVQEILDTVGGVPDRSGKPGVDQAKVDAFFAEAQALSDWHARAEADRTLLPLGDATPAAAAAYRAVAAKIDDFFTRCRVAALDARAAAALNGSEADFAALASQELRPDDPNVARLPLARVESGKAALPLSGGINPAWRARLAAFAAALEPLLGPGRATLSESDWLALGDKLAPHLAWAAEKPATAVEKLGLERLRALLAGPARARLTERIAADVKAGEEEKPVVEVERALRYKRELREVLENFVNFSRFYRREAAAFQAGKLLLDGRRCSLCMEVGDAGRHASLAGMAAAYLAYCDITRPGAKKTIVAAFTDGDADELFVGRNGIFYDRDGKDWDATITKVVENPISVRQAFWAPYKKLARFIEEQVAKRGAAKEAESDALLAKAATTAAHVDEAAATAPPPAPKKIDVGTVAAIGVAVGGIGAMIVGLATAFFGLGIWIPVAIAGILLAISGPSMLLAWLKLRRRNLGPILDANGWAINSRARINVPFGGALTELAVLPRGALRSLEDPFAERRPPWRLYAVLLVVMALGATWYSGALDRFLPEAVQKTTVFGP